MDNNRKQRYVLAVYIIIALIAIILYLLSEFYIENGNVHDLIINLSSELIGVVIIFFIVNQLFFIDFDGDVTTRFEKVISDLEKRFAVICTESQSLERLDFPKKLTTAKSFDLMAIDASNLLVYHLNELIHAAENGVSIRIILTDTYSQSAELLQERIHRVDKGFKLYDYRPVVLSIDSKIRKDVSDNLQIRLINWIPSCRLLSFDMDTNDGAIIANIYPIDFTEPDYQSRVSVFITPYLDLKKYNQFRNQFNKAWESSIDWREANYKSWFLNKN